LANEESQRIPLELHYLLLFKSLTALTDSRPEEAEVLPIKGRQTTDPNLPRHKLRRIIVSATSNGIIKLSCLLISSGMTRGGIIMELRAHPLMSYRNLPNWPPTWVWLYGKKNLYPRGEIGVLREVRQPDIGAPNRVFLVIEYLGSTYMGCLLFDNNGFCRDVHKLLLRHIGTPVADIGGLDVRHLL
jgi:hypothetical protein